MEAAGSRLLLKQRRWRRKRARRIDVGFRAVGIGAERPGAAGESPHHVALQQYGDLDIALDPFFPWRGHNELEAFWMGFPW